MISVVHVTAPAQMGGLERVVEGIALGAARLGNKVAIVAVLDIYGTVPSWLRRVENSGVTVDIVRLPSRAYWRERREVLARIVAFNPDVVHTHGYRSDVLIGPVARRAGFAIVSTAHGFTSVGWKDRAFAWLQRRAWRRFDAVIAVSAPLDLMLRRRMPSRRVHLIPNDLPDMGRPTLQRAESRARLALPPDSKVIGWVGRLSPEKGPDIAIQTLRQMRNKEAILCFVGSGDALHSCRALVSRLNLQERVTFKGAVEHAVELFNGFDVLLLSSRTEGTPLVLLEAALAGVPIVATAVGGVPDLVGPDGALIAPPESPSELAAALDRTFDNHDEAMMRAAKLRSRLDASRLRNDWVKRHIGLYRAIARSPDASAN